jgi:hypothetical protein
MISSFALRAEQLRLRHCHLNRLLWLFVEMKLDADDDVAAAVVATDGAGLQMKLKILGE